MPSLDLNNKKSDCQSCHRLLEVAEALFAEKGYTDTSIRDITRQAGCNVAAVNYHFGSKDALYIAVWKNAFEESLKVYPPDGGLPPDAPPQQRLHAVIYSLLHRILDDNRLGYAGKILLQEITNPTEVIHQVRHDVLRPLRERTRGIIKDLLGLQSSQKNIEFCEMSVIHQCLAIGFRKGRLSDPLFKEKIAPHAIDDLVDHITHFSLAGIDAVRTNHTSEKS